MFYANFDVNLNPNKGFVIIKLKDLLCQKDNINDEILDFFISDKKI